MKAPIVVLLILLSCKLFSQGHDTLALAHRATFDVVFDQNALGKEGYHLNGYIVIISAKHAKKIQGKKVRITGMVTIIEGFKHRLKNYDENGNEIRIAGGEEDAKFILSPTIEVIEK